MGVTLVGRTRYLDACCACRGSLAIIASSFALLTVGCVSQQQLNDFVEERGNMVRSRFAADRAAERLDLENKTPCCDDLASVSPARNVSGEAPYSISLGSWPNRQVMETDGFRSYYALISLDAGKSNNRHLVVDSQSTVTGLVDRNTGFREGWVLVPVATFFDEKRQRISTADSTLNQVPGSLNWRAKFAIPASAVLAAVHTTAEKLNGSKLSGVVAGSTTASPLPIGGAALVVRSDPGFSLLTPSVKGHVSISVE